MADKLVTLKDESGQKIYPETRAKVVKTEAGKTLETELGEKLTEAPKDGKQYARKDGAWAEVEAGDELSKDAIEQALTGNITTHRHDTTYNYTDFETDVWDGTSVSSSLQGSGTKDDPYLIQSCADWLHLYVNGLASYNTQSTSEAPTVFSPVFKLNKNLDFGNKTIPVPNLGDNIELSMGLCCEFDGSGAMISNFNPPSSYELIPGISLGLFPLLYLSFVHDFVIDNAQYDVAITDGGGEIALFTFPSYNMHILSANNVIRAKATITGNISGDTASVAAYLSSNQATMLSPALKSQFDKYKEEHGYSFGISIDATDNTVKDNGGKLAIVMMALTEPGLELFTSTPLDEISVSESGITFESDFVISIMIAGEPPAHFYTNSSGSNSIIIQDMESSAHSTFTGTPKSLAEMKSASFVEELNSHLPKPAFRQDPDGGTPILAGGNATIAYDGYVKKSEFESFKQNMPTSTVKPNDFIYELKPDVYGLTDNTPSEDISAAIGGEEGMKAIIQAIKDGYRFVIRGELSTFTIGVLNTELNAWAYKEDSNGDLTVAFGGIGYALFGGIASFAAISYTKSSNTFKIETSNG